MPAGRPSKYNPEYCERVVELGAQGYAMVEIAAELGCVKQTLHNWKEENPEFLAAMQRAIELSEAWWTRKGRENLDADKFQTGLWYANMKNRFGWRDRQETEHSGEIGFKEVRRTIVDSDPQPDS